MPNTPHLDKLEAACRNVKCEDGDVRLLKEAKERYSIWKKSLQALAKTGKPRVIEMTRLLNEYKDFLEVDVIARRASARVASKQHFARVVEPVKKDVEAEIASESGAGGISIDHEFRRRP